LLCYGFRIESGNYILERGLKESNFHIERNWGFNLRRNSAIFSNLRKKFEMQKILRRVNYNLLIVSGGGPTGFWEFWKATVLNMCVSKIVRKIYPTHKRIPAPAYGVAPL
jgi:hypothetical protein